MASIVLAAGRSRTAARVATLLVGVATLLGSMTIAILPEDVVYYALPMSAGVTLYVAASDLIPEVNEKGGLGTSTLVFAGVALYYVTELALSALHLGE